MLMLVMVVKKNMSLGAFSRTQRTWAKCHLKSCSRILVDNQIQSSILQIQFDR